MIHKILSGLLFLLFAVFSGIQYNDPDPIQWMIIYGIVAIICLMRIFDFSMKKANLWIMIVLAVFSFIYIPGFLEWLSTPDKNEIFGEMVYQKPYIEETREFIGLLIAIAGMFYQYRISNKPV